jgi:U6 snRNA-associated Sm-like protein LSm1
VLTETRERYFVTVPPSVSTNPHTDSTLTPSESQQHARNLYCDIPRGTFLVRGENVLLLGEVDLDKDDEPPPGYEEGDVEEVFRLQKQAEGERKRKDKARAKRTAWRDPEGSGEVLF